MKTKTCITALFFGLFFFQISIQETHAQIFQKIKKEVKRRTENKVVNKVGNTTNKVIDKVTTLPGDKKSDGDNNTAQVTDNGKKEQQVTDHSYKNYDFVPGDKIIFQPDLSGEADAELPARFVIDKGVSEIQSYEGEKILHINSGGKNVVFPLMEHQNYLPDQFTIEFDLMYENTASYFQYFNSFMVAFNDENDNNWEGHNLYRFSIESNSKSAFGKYGTQPMDLPESVKKSVNSNDVWHHVALYVRKNIGKAYIDGSRVFATNNLPAGAARFAFRTDGRYGMKIKNLRVAAGGEDKYKKIVTNGKFITHGILFDVNKSTIKPESMGTLNEIAKLMKEHSDLKFEINGHTDSDGNADTNQKLSEARAIAVKDKLVEMGIAENRFTTKGNGASKPIDSNSTQEGKANNRRVEFVKL